MSAATEGMRNAVATLAGRVRVVRAWFANPLGKSVSLLGFCVVFPCLTFAGLAVASYQARVYWFGEMHRSYGRVAFATELMAYVERAARLRAEPKSRVAYAWRTGADGQPARFAETERGSLDLTGHRSPHPREDRPAIAGVERGDGGPDLSLTGFGRVECHAIGRVSAYTLSRLRIALHGQGRPVPDAAEPGWQPAAWVVEACLREEWTGRDATLRIADGSSGD